MNFPFFRVDKVLAPLSESEANVARELTLGNSHKKIASKRNKSTHTINQQTRVAMEKTKSRNVADLTRWVLSRYFGQREDVVINTIKDSMVLLTIGSLTWALIALA